MSFNGKMSFKVRYLSRQRNNRPTIPYFMHRKTRAAVYECAISSIDLVHYGTAIGLIFFESDTRTDSIELVFQINE